MAFTITVPDIQQGPGFLWYAPPVPANPGRFLVDASGNPVTTGNAWVTATAYSLGQTIVDASGNLERVVVPGTSGATVPTFATGLFAKTTDGTSTPLLTWQNLGPAAYAMGATDGPTSFHAEGKVEEIVIDQEPGPIDSVLTAENAYIEATFKEASLVKIAKALIQGASYTTGTDTGLPAGAQTYEQVTIGGLVAIPEAPLMLVSQRRQFTNKYFVAGLYSATPKTPYSIGVTRSKEILYKMRWDGMALLYRAQGDRIAQHYRQT